MVTGNDELLEKSEFPFEGEKVEKKIVFKDREVWAEVSRTMKTSESKYEFSKFALGFRASIGDDVSRERPTLMPLTMVCAMS